MIPFMNNFKLALKLLKGKHTRNAVFVFSHFLVSSIMLLLFNLMSNTAYTELELNKISVNVVNSMTNAYEDVSIGNFFMVMAFVATLYSIMMLFYIYNVFYSSQDVDFVNLSLSGFSPSKLIRVYFIQFLILGLPSLVLGILFSTRFIIPTYDNYIYSNLGINGPIGLIYRDTYLFFSALIILVLMTVFIDQFGKLSGSTIIERLNGAPIFTLNIKEKENKHSFSLIYVIIYFILLLLFTLKHGAKTHLLLGLAAVIICIHLFTSDIPNILKLLKNKFYGKYTLPLISLLQDDLKGESISSILLIICTILTMSSLSNKEVSYINFVSSFVALVFIVSMIAVLLFMSYFADVSNRTKVFYNISLLGYRRKDNRRILIMEIIIFYLLIIFVPGLLGIVMVINSIVNKYLAIDYGLSLLLGYVTPLLISMFVTIIIYLNELRKEAKKIL